MNAYQVLQARIAAGNPPAGMQMHSAQIRQFAKEGLLRDLDSIAESRRLGQGARPAARRLRQDRRRIGSARRSTPTGTTGSGSTSRSSTNTAASTGDLGRVLRARRQDEGRTGVIPIAHGGQAWQELFLWEAVLNGVGGPGRSTRSAIEQLKPDALNSDTMRKVFDTYRKVAQLRRSGLPQSRLEPVDCHGHATARRRWRSPATGRLARFNVAGKKANVDYVCANGPGTEGQFVWLADYWASSRASTRAARRRTAKLADITMDPAIQEEFNIRKARFPPGSTSSPTSFGPCGQKGIADRAAALKSGGMVPSLSQNSAQTTDVRGVFEDVGQRIRQHARHDRRPGDRQDHPGLVRALASPIRGGGLPPPRGLGARLHKMRAFRSSGLQALSTPRPTTVRRARPVRRGRRGWLNVLVVLPTVVIVFVFVYGFVSWSVALSFTDSKTFPTFNFVGLQQYISLWSNSRWHASVTNLAVFTVGFVGLSTILGLVIAILLDRKVKAEGLFRTIYLYPLAISFIVTGTAWKWALNPGLGLDKLMHDWGFPSFHFDWITNPDRAIYTLIIAAVWQGSGFAMAVFLAALRGVDEEIIKAAKIDGAGVVRIYWSVVMPLLRPAFLTVFIIMVALAFRTFD
jgi:glucose/mannose transport system permease protein